MVPVFLLDVRLNKGDHSGDDRVVHCLGEERKTCASSHRNVPFTLLGILVLAGKKLKEHGNDFRQCDLGKVFGSVDISIEEALKSCLNTKPGTRESSIAYLLCIEVIALEVGFLFSN
jgi:hypothetical protein